MPLNETLKQYPTREGSITYSNNNSDTYITVNTSSYDKNQKQPNPSTLGDTIIVITPILFILTTVGIGFYRFRQVQSASLPCKNCKYYNSNNYLKCAVNPEEVLTEKSKQCRDYTPQERKFSWSWKGFGKRD